MENKEEDQYLDLIRDVLDTGVERECRNGRTKSLFGRSLTFDLKKGFPLLTTKKVFFRGVFEELMFFIRGETDTKKLEAKGINIWKLNTSREFLDNVGLPHYNEGDMGCMYGYQMRFFNKPYTGCHVKEQGGYDQLQYVIDTILNDPYSRRIMYTVYNPSQVAQGCLYPCHSIITQFYVREEGDTKYVSQQTYIRSQDVICGQPFNIASSALLTLLICHHLNGIKNSQIYHPDMLHITLGDYHIYEAHYDIAKEQITRKPFPFPKLNIKCYKQSIEDYEFEDIELIDYNCHPKLNAPMVA